jgi:hypothetical protein
MNKDPRVLAIQAKNFADCSQLERMLKNALFVAKSCREAAQFLSDSHKDYIPQCVLNQRACEEEVFAERCLEWISRGLEDIKDTVD